MRVVSIFLILLSNAFAATTEEQQARRVVADYVGLYAAKTLPQWKALFHPQMTASHATADGTIRVRTFAEFTGAQEKGFQEDPEMRETLENVQLFLGNNLARVTADYVFASKGVSRRGKLGLHLLKGSEGWKIVGVVFSYDRE